MELPIFISVGAAVVLFGVWLLRTHNQTIQRFRDDCELTEKQRSAFITQHRRRRIATSLVIIVGLLIPFSYYTTTVIKNPMAASLVLLGILILILFIFLLAIGDIIAGKFSREDLSILKAETELKRRILEHELEKHQKIKEDHHQEIRRNGSS